MVFALYGFDFSPDGSDGSSFNSIKVGNLSLTLRLQKPAAESITIVCYMEFETLPEKPRFRESCAYVCNTDDTSGPGKQWVFFLPSRKYW